MVRPEADLDYSHLALSLLQRTLNTFGTKHEQWVIMSSSGMCGVFLLYALWYILFSKTRISPQGTFCATRSAVSTRREEGRRDPSPRQTGGTEHRPLSASVIPKQFTPVSVAPL